MWLLWKKKGDKNDGAFHYKGKNNYIIPIIFNRNFQIEEKIWDNICDKNKLIKKFKIKSYKKEYYLNSPYPFLYINTKDKIFKSAKFSGIIPFGNYDWKDVFEMGFDLTTAGTELSILRDSSRKIIKEFRN